MDKKKLILPTTLGDIETEISYTRELPQGDYSLINMSVDILPVVVDCSLCFNRDPFVDITITQTNLLKLVFQFDRIKTKMAKIIEDEDYYHIKIFELVRVPRNKHIALQVTIDASFSQILFSEKPTKEVILQRARREMARYQSQYNQNVDGRLPKGTIYGWGGTR
ncbi:hypothetical protein [Metabacillus litoralis]|uniref:hypothetical protein n=1 Tax=Metabacillus litoralis TaxID=152268 RepID=UPI000EF5A772|nr:hypothetical protein [Metabacillus litoralis]